MKLLLLMRNLMYLRNYEGLVRELAARGHRVTIGYEDARDKAPPEIKEAADRLAADCPTIELTGVPARADAWSVLAHQARVLRDYTRYQHPRYAAATRCAERAASLVHPTLRRLAFRGGRRSPERAERLAELAHRVEAALPEDPAVAAVIERDRPDLLLVTPLIDFGSTQVDYLKAAARRGIPTGLLVASWDNLTNKGLIPVLPDRVFVWNADQAEETASLHGVPRERVVVTGAQLFDDWFGRRPSQDRAAFCRDVGLDPGKPVVLYTCSSIFISRLESEFLVRWLGALRSSPDPLLREAGVLIRPHPGSTKRAAQWNDPRIAAFGRVVVRPASGGYPVTDENRRFYFDSIFHAAAVVGINTSAMLEAAIVGRPCFTIRDAETEQAQDGMLHFAYLTRYGFVRPAPDMAAHLAQLAAALRDGPDDPERAGSVEAFLRPQGLRRPATPILADAIEAMAGLQPQGLGLPETGAGLRAVLWPLARLFRLLSAQRTGKKWLREHPLLQRLRRLLSTAEADYSGNLWYRLRRVRRRGARLAAILLRLPAELLRHRSLRAAKQAAVAKTAGPQQRGGRPGA
ncbi:hypothetical protein SAMN06265365_107182 [Tistlia consotensis]|uniref:Uncharacterized protein n=1 Tax=Tistlia consotensis USBA 355 TaxID=560819 RepID=A0A1Y6B9V3_9PROT|nr:hypothetical protein [Tistlia consotensis]SME98568.1 hypothetical protein SAMN05428998_102184 [Tistlia consotensis USBA 355]SNR57958.1 hypothetical protein SAMN06265365_107182 [Tistlia consotensis]